MGGPEFEMLNAQEMLSELHDECCMPYLDDVLRFATSFQEHVQVLQIVLQSLQQRGMKLKLEKYDLICREV